MSVAIEGQKRDRMPAGTFFHDTVVNNMTSFLPVAHTDRQGLYPHSIYSPW